MFRDRGNKEPSERWNQRSQRNQRWIVLGISLVGAILAYFLTRMMLRG